MTGEMQVGVLLSASATAFRSQRLLVPRAPDMLSPPPRGQSLLASFQCTRHG